MFGEDRFCRVEAWRLQLAAHIAREEVKSRTVARWAEGEPLRAQCARLVAQWEAAKALQARIAALTAPEEGGGGGSDASPPAPSSVGEDEKLLQRRLSSGGGDGREHNGATSAAPAGADSTKNGGDGPVAGTDEDDCPEMFRECLRLLRCAVGAQRIGCGSKTMQATPFCPRDVRHHRVHARSPTHMSAAALLAQGSGPEWTLASEHPRARSAAVEFPPSFSAPFLFSPLSVLPFWQLLHRNLD